MYFNILTEDGEWLLTEQLDPIPLEPTTLRKQWELTKSKWTTE